MTGRPVQLFSAQAVIFRHCRQLIPEQPQPASLKEQDFIRQISENQGIIYKLVGLYARDAEEKKDLYQDILLQTWKAWPGFRGDSKFSTWLYRVSLNTILSHQRKENRKPVMVEPDEDIHTLDDQLPGRQEKEALRKAIRQLKETDRAVVTLHLDGYDNGEIADMLGITPNYVAVKLNRIKAQLQQHLNPGS